MSRHERNWAEKTCIVVSLLILAASVALLLQQRTFFLWGPQRSLLSEPTIVYTIVTWDWPLTLLLIIGECILISSILFRRSLSMPSIGFMLACMIAVFYCQQVLSDAGTGGSAFQEIARIRAPSPGAGGVRFPTEPWQENRINRQFYLDPSFSISIVLGAGTIALSLGFLISSVCLSIRSLPPTKVDVPNSAPSG